MRSCYRNCWTLAVEHRLTTIAFPAISTGVYGYPREEAAEVASRAIAGVLSQDRTITQVRLVFFQLTTRGIFEATSAVSG